MPGPEAKDVQETKTTRLAVSTKTCRRKALWQARSHQSPGENQAQEADDKEFSEMKAKCIRCHRTTDLPPFDKPNLVTSHDCGCKGGRDESSDKRWKDSLAPLLAVHLPPLQVAPGNPGHLPQSSNWIGWRPAHVCRGHAPLHPRSPIEPWELSRVEEPQCLTHLLGEQVIPFASRPLAKARDVSQRQPPCSRGREITRFSLCEIWWLKVFLRNFFWNTDLKEAKCA